MNNIQELKGKDLLKHIEFECGSDYYHAGTDAVRYKKCPICGHGDHFTINTKGNYYNSFGNACGKGSIIDFHMNLNNVDCKTAIKELSDHYNISFNRTEKETKKMPKVINETKDKIFYDDNTVYVKCDNMLYDCPTTNNYPEHEENIMNEVLASYEESNNANNIQVDDFLNIGIIKVGNITYKMNNYKELKNSTTKLLVFSIMNIKESYISKFTLKDYMNFRSINDKKGAINKIKDDLELLKSIEDLTSIKGDWNYKKLIIGGDYNNGKVNIEFHPAFAESLKKFYMYIPYELLSINDKYYPHAWTLGYFIFEYARLNKKLSFDLNISSCLKRISIPSKKEVAQKMDRHFENKIIKPFESTIDILSESIPDLNIILANDYTNITEFEKGKIKINIDNKQLKEIYGGIKTKKITNSKESLFSII